MTKHLASLLLSVLTLTAAESMPTGDLIGLSLSKPDSPQFREALLATLRDSELKAGTAALSDRGNGLFALESASLPALFVDDAPSLAMKRLSGTQLWFAAVPMKTGCGHSFHYVIDGKRFGGKADVPSFGPDSYATPGVPQGKLSEKTVFTSKLYDGMQSNYWVYTPAQYDPKISAALMVCQQYIRRDSASVRLLEVIDNLTYRKKLPPIVWVFTSPGDATMTSGSPTYEDVKKLATANRQTALTNAVRTVEYETLSDRYALFLRDELLAEVQSKYNIRKDGYSRAISGLSSGALGAFTAAWEQPDQFSRVLTWVAPFTSVRWQPGVRDGGNIYPFKIRKEPKKNLRLWIQDGADDVENVHGSVPLQNIQFANSLKLRDYDFHFSFGVGGHSPMQGSSELPESLAWLWRDYDPSKTQETYQMEDAEKSRPFFRVHIFNRE